MRPKDGGGRGRSIDGSNIWRNGDQLERNVDEMIDECNAQVKNREERDGGVIVIVHHVPSQVSLRIKGWQTLLLRLLTAH